MFGDESPTDPQPILVAHGTRSPRGILTIGRIAEQLGALIGPTPTTFVDVVGPSPSEVLRDTDRPAVVVPAFLAAGYHVRRDIPEHIAASGHPSVTLCENLGPDPVLAEILADRLRAAGYRPGDAVVLAAAGSSDPHALAEVDRAADLLARRLGDEVAVGYVATGSPKVADVVTACRRRGRRRVVVASYLLAPGLFHDRVLQCGADGAAAPLGSDLRIAELLATRFRVGAAAVRLGPVPATGADPERRGR